MFYLMYILMFIGGVLVGVGLNNLFNKFPDEAGTLHIVYMDKESTGMYLELDGDIESLCDKQYIFLAVRNNARN